MNQITQDGTVTTLFVENFKEKFFGTYGCTTDVSSYREATSLRFYAILRSCWWIVAITLLGLFLVSADHLAKMGVVIGITWKIVISTVIIFLGVYYVRSAYRQIMQEVPYVAALIFISGHERLFQALECLGIDTHEAEMVDLTTLLEMICPTGISPDSPEQASVPMKVRRRNAALRLLGQVVPEHEMYSLDEDGDVLPQGLS